MKKLMEMAVGFGVEPVDLARSWLEWFWAVSRSVSAQPVCERRRVMRLATTLGRQSPDVFDKPDTQHDRDGPDLPDRERRRVLVAFDESSQVLFVNAGVGVG